jgi:hypothetical protein
MAEEEVVETEVTEEVVKEAVVETNDEQKTSEVETLAKQMGWNPDHKDGDREYKSAEEYILNGRDIQNTMSKQLRDSKRKMDGLESGLKMLKTHNETVYNAQVVALKGKIAELKTQRAEAVEDGDNKAVAVIDGQMQDINAIPDKLPEGDGMPDPVFIEWQDKNNWYEDAEMKAYADWQGDNNVALRGLPQKKFLESITNMVKDNFPENFKAKKKTTPTAPTVEGGGNRRPKETIKGSQFSDLSREQQDIATDLEKRGIMPREEYIQKLEEIAEARK